MQMSKNVNNDVTLLTDSHLPTELFDYELIMNSTRVDRWNKSDEMLLRMWSFSRSALHSLFYCYSSALQFKLLR